jgi:hypothetical protein
MFKKSDKNTQFDLFGGMSCVLVGRALKVYGNEKGWHNQFRIQVVSRIDESPYKVLYNEGMGAPNAPIATLLGMMILKEAFGWSDAQMFENCSFNLLVRGALGLFNINDEIPAESTYYLLRSRMYNYNKLHGVDLLANTFETITRGQVKTFKVNADSIRMDSKLISSNIAFYSRYEIIHRTLLKFLKSVDTEPLKKLSTEQRSLIEQIMGEDSQKTVYRSNKDQITKFLIPIGLLIVRLLKLYRGTCYKTEYYQILSRVFFDQYELDGPSRVKLLDSEKINPESVQSPDDPDATFRNKGKQKVKGYSVNVTETVSEEGYLDLVTDVDVRKASTPDKAYVRDAIKATSKVTDQLVKKAYADGGYQSSSNDIKGIDMVYTGIQGNLPRYEPELKRNELTIKDTQTGEIILASKVNNRKGNKSWSFTDSEGKRHYVTQNAVRSSQKRRELKQRTPEELRKRNNVEATIFQLSYPLKNAKSKYRGLFKQQLWAYCRCLWVNLVRIVNFETQTC